MTRIAGVILAGGRSSRMGGGDKALRQLARRSLIGRVCERLSPQVDLLAVNANGDPERFSFLGVPVVPDTLEGHAGPLAGVLAGLGWAQTEGFSRMVSVAADTPFFPPDLVQRLAIAAADRDDIAVARFDGGAHPVFALWPVSASADLQAFLTSGRKASVMGFLATRRHRFADFERMGATGTDPFFNINTPADLTEAERLARDKEQ